MAPGLPGLVSVYFYIHASCCSSCSREGLVQLHGAWGFSAEQEAAGPHLRLEPAGPEPAACREPRNMCGSRSQREPPPAGWPRRYLFARNVLGHGRGDGTVGVWRSRRPPTWSALHPRLILLPSPLRPQPETKCRGIRGGCCSPFFQKNDPTADSRSLALGKAANSPGLRALPCDDLSFARGHGRGGKALSSSAASSGKPVLGNSGKRRLSGRREAPLGVCPGSLGPEPRSRGAPAAAIHPRGSSRRRARAPTFF